MDCAGECGGSQVEDDCGVCGGDGSECDTDVDNCTSQVCINLTESNLNYTSSENIAGFQFTHNGCVSSASGGDAAANGFIVSVSGTTVLGFSFTGAVISSSEGTLLSLDAVSYTHLTLPTKA